ncbi:MAG: GTP 3',8-cyclase MoaA [Candidatus Kapaibacterium sp.]
MKQLIDKYDRVHDYLRISLIDRCNLNCFYCNPINAPSTSSARSSILSYEELARLVKLFVVDHGFKKIRLTGGEPMVRKDIIPFFKELNKIKKNHPFEIGLTTNGTLLEDKLEILKENGLDRLNISLDTLQRNKFKEITAHDKFLEVIRAIEKAETLGFHPLKINAVAMRGVNDDEFLDFIDYFKGRNINLRFIEFMPFSNNDWSENKFIGYKEIIETISTQHKLLPLKTLPHAVSKDYDIVGEKIKLSFITSMTEHFCGDCNRLRITANGRLKLCLLSDKNSGLNFKELLNSHSDESISHLLQIALYDKPKEHPPAKILMNFTDNKMMSIGG